MTESIKKIGHNMKSQKCESTWYTAVQNAVVSKSFFTACNTFRIWLHGQTRKIQFDRILFNIFCFGYFLMIITAHQFILILLIWQINIITFLEIWCSETVKTTDDSSVFGVQLQVLNRRRVIITAFNLFVQ